ncbi:MAG: hypothetical protein KIT87_03905 [Anaerolineae bacterium]|nr:hypothetical protein [Anaerolineae bacterium]
MKNIHQTVQSYFNSTSAPAPATPPTLVQYALPAVPAATTPTPLKRLVLPWREIAIALPLFLIAAFLIRAVLDGNLRLFRATDTVPALSTPIVVERVVEKPVERIIEKPVERVIVAAPTSVPPPADHRHRAPDTAPGQPTAAARPIVASHPRPFTVAHDVWQISLTRPASQLHNPPQRNPTYTRQYWRAWPRRSPYTTYPQGHIIQGYYPDPNGIPRDAICTVAGWKSLE